MASPLGILVLRGRATRNFHKSENRKLIKSEFLMNCVDLTGTVCTSRLVFLGDIKASL